MTTFKKASRQQNIPLAFIYDAVTEGNGATLYHYDEIDSQDIIDFNRLLNAEPILAKYFDVICDNSYGHVEEFVYTVNPKGYTSRTKKQRSRKHAQLVRAQQIAKQIARQ